MLNDFKLHLYYFKCRNKTKENAKIAIKNHLYIDGWTLLDSLKEVLNNGKENNYYVNIAYRDNKAVAVIYATSTHIQIFVKREYRRRGIGKQLINRLVKYTGKKDFKVYKGIHESTFFWNSFKKIKLNIII